jgi:hypothetical protein
MRSSADRPSKGAARSMTDRQYQVALDEYEAICAYHRSEDQLKWQVLGIAYGGAGLLASAAVSARYSYAALALAALAAVIVTFGTAVTSRLQQYTMWRLERAWELEEQVLGFEHHTRVRDRDRESEKKSPIVRLIKLGYWLPWVIWVAFVLVTVARRG